MNLLEVPIGRHAPGVINVVIEIPRGSKKRYQYNPQRHSFDVEYRFSIPMPTEYGWIPETLSVDNEHLDAMVVTRYLMQPGYICEVRPIGTLKRKDKDHKVICVALNDDKCRHIQDISDLDAKMLKKITSFFEPYFELDGWLGVDETYELIRESCARYVAKRKGAHNAGNNN
ncbi:MAG: inorganic diphosphatase [Candidatus Poribacteria bacterium]